MRELWQSLQAAYQSEIVLDVIRGLLLLFGGLLVARLASAAAGRVLAKRLSAQRTMLIRRGTYYTIVALVGASALRHLGFDLSVLLGAAGILTVALGFASQTSASHLISGLFLLGEQPFVVGDVVRVGDTTGEVLSIEWLSVRLRTFDNLMVRIPNETLLRSEITNLTRFPIRRADLQLGVAYKEDLARVQSILLEVAEKNPLCLDEPKPLIIARGFGDSAIDFQFSVWAKRENFLELRNGMYRKIKEAFDAAGVEIPFPHRSLYTGSMTEPLPVRLMDAVPQGEPPGSPGGER